MAVETYRFPHDVPLSQAMLVWTRGEKVGVVPHPDRQHLSAGFRSSVGACFADWRKKSPDQRKAQLMVEAWHIAAFYDIPAEAVHEALLCIPEYRDMLAADCLPARYQSERD